MRLAAVTGTARTDLKPQRMNTNNPSADFINAVTIAGAFVRYGFYAAGVFVLMAMGIIPFLRSDPVQRIDDKPAFRLASPELARLPVTGSVITGRGSRMEMRQYGRLHDRDKDFTAVMVMSPKGNLTGARDFNSEINDLGPLRGGIYLGAFHDLQTRMGPVRASEFRIAADGRWKLCLAYVSRFDTAAVTMKGWYCEASGVKASPWDLACALDSLALDGPLASAEADAFLRARLRQRPNCSAAPVTQTTDTRPARPTVRRY
jgi:hypothetical protein